MKDVLDKCSDKGCSIDIGSVLDNENCTVTVTNRFDTYEQAMAHFEEMEISANNVASEKYPCHLSHTVKILNKKYIARIDMTFSCQAEAIIFELEMQHRIHD
ncbi:DUF406 family protein [Serratia quinivorans]|jgi:uncharacterized protein (TIGR00743 family)|uniref:DUF406 family protein n=1 Tax=Serratia TaxID=613 RepID=UPI00217B1640|nr:DUF406 family protein [Serratia quinivorans]CAI0901208.1 Protein of uncharacterised function (DUF406) [Serratia quinivorans]CAI1113345.1 Protein of uncharacterised function (DUF406) [Serratia quinivorans]CAI1146164.1 Protein of uncharacterised function (DUF406) [Serratia quinivorans]CAI1953267.1 Protein of uncharacterised function (DUF406) [Serratia quinivorans]